MQRIGVVLLLIGLLLLFLPGCTELGFLPTVGVNITINLGGQQGPRAYVTNPGNRTVDVIDAGAHSLLASIDVGGEPIAVAIANKKAYVTMQNTTDVIVIDTITNRVIQTATGHLSGHVARTFADKVYIVGGPNGSPVTIIDSLTGASTTLELLQACLVDITFAAEKAYIAHASHSRCSIIDTQSNTHLSTIQLTTGNYNHCATANGKVYVAAFGNEGVHVIDPATDSVTGIVILSSSENPGTHDLTAYNNRLYAPLFNDGVVVVIDAVTDTVVNPGIPLDWGVTTCVVSSGKVYVADQDKTFVIDPSTDTVLKVIPSGSEQMFADGAGQVYLLQDDEIIVIDSDSDTIVASIPTGGQLGDIAFLP